MKCKVFEYFDMKKKYYIENSKIWGIQLNITISLILKNLQNQNFGTFTNNSRIF